MKKSRIRILYVEDDVVDRMACRRWFAQDTFDYEFVLSEAETAQEGLQLARTQPLDCVLLDYNLPDMNGLEFLTELKNDQEEIPVPVIMLTGADNASVAVESIKLGAQDYVVKDPNLQYLELLPSVIQRVLRDVLAQKEKTEMELSLARAEAKYRFLVEQIPAITYSTELDAPGKLLFISPQIIQLGYTAEELLADTEGILKLLHPEDKTLVYSKITSSHESGESLRCECRLLTRSGEVRWFLNEASMLRHELDEPPFLQGILIDITNDKVVEEELLQHRRRLEELVTNRTTQFEKQIKILKSANTNLVGKLGTCEQARGELREYAEQLSEFCLEAPCGYCSLDQDGVFAKVNDTMLKWTGCTREEMVGKMKFTDLLTSDGVKLVNENFKQLKKRNTVRDLEIEITRKDGTKFTVLLITKVIKDRDGHLLMSHSMMIDITSSVKKSKGSASK